MKVIYTTKNHTFSDCDPNTIIIVDANKQPYSLQYILTTETIWQSYISIDDIEQCINALPNDKNTSPPKDQQMILHHVLLQHNRIIAQRAQHYKLNLLHFLAHIPGDIHRPLSEIIRKCPEAASAIDIFGKTPIHYAITNQSIHQLNQDCYNLLLSSSPNIVVHRAIQAEMEWRHLFPLIKAKIHSLTEEDDETKLLPFMIVAEKCGRQIYELGNIYELLLMKPDALKEYAALYVSKGDGMKNGDIMNGERKRRRIVS